jgi:hypothetical protein
MFRVPLVIGIASVLPFICAPAPVFGQEARPNVCHVKLPGSFPGQFTWTSYGQHQFRNEVRDGKSMRYSVCLVFSHVANVGNGEQQVFQVLIPTSREATYPRRSTLPTGWSSLGYEATTNFSPELPY